MIGFDIDNTIIDLEYMLEQKWNSVPKDKIPIFYSDKDRMNWEFIRKYTKDAPLMPRAKEYLIKFYAELGRPLIFITARPITHHSILRKYFIEKFGNSFEYKIICVGHNSKKINAIKDNDLDMYVDDNVEVCNELSKHLKVVFLIINDKNKFANKRRNVIACSDLQDVFNKFQYQSKLKLKDNKDDEDEDIPPRYSSRFFREGEEEIDFSDFSKNKEANELKKEVKRITSVSDIKSLLRYSHPLSYFTPGKIIYVSDKMQSNYNYVLKEKVGVWESFEDFKPQLTPHQMLEYGVFEGKYLNDCVLEYPREWFESAIKNHTLSPNRPNQACNFFSVKARQNLSVWKKNRWIIGDDPRGWFQWYCRFYIGRRDYRVDKIQVNRWKSFGNRHLAQILKYCEKGDLDCRPKQRQALLQWAYDTIKL